MKALLIDRLIALGKQSQLPGFGREKEVLVAKFQHMPEPELLTCFEQIVIQCHQDGIQ